MNRKTGECDIDTGKKGIEKSARLQSVPRHGVSKQAVMSQLSLFNHVPRY
jgi:hypothetical protein